MSRSSISWQEFARIFLVTGARSFGGWSATALLLETELVTKRKVLTRDQLHGAVAYAQILPGATQVAIVSNTGYRLRGMPGALVATGCYLLPALSLITLFASLYFHVAQGAKLMPHMGGLIAALGGVIVANAYNIGKRHVSHPLLWLAVIAALLARLVLDVNAVIIILSFGVAGLLYSFVAAKRKQA